MFVIWQPILETDWRALAAKALSRFSDRRVLQFWDKDHVLAARLARDARPPQPKPDCCERNGILWDLAAVYPPRAFWDEALPAAVVFNGPVVRMQSEITAAIVGSALP